MKLHTYKYTAKTKDGKVIKGHLEAISYAFCVKYLQSRNYVIDKVSEHNNVFVKLGQITFGKVLSGKQLIFFLKQLGALLTSNINLLDSLELLSLQQENHLIRRLYFEVYLDVYNGYTFSYALGKHTNDFPLLLVRMVEVGEISGKLASSILEMAKFFEKQFKMVSSIKGTVRMPIIYFLATIAIAIGMMVFVFPNMEDLFASFGNAQLPGITQILIDTGTYLSENILSFALILIGFILAFYLALKFIKSFHLLMTKFSIKIPIFGSLISTYNQILIANSLGQMIKNGINSLQALKTTSTLIKNDVYHAVIVETIKNVEDGLPFSKSFVESNYIDPIMSHMIITGEKSGNLPVFLENMSIYYNEVSDLKIEKIKGALQPILLLFVYAIVGALLLALIMPMLSLGTQI